MEESGCHWRLVRQCDERQHWQQAASGTHQNTVDGALAQVLPVPTMTDSCPLAHEAWGVIRAMPVSRDTECTIVPQDDDGSRRPVLDPENPERPTAGQFTAFV